MVARLALGVVVVAVLGWLALGMRATRLEGEGAELAGRSPATASPQRLERARDAYRRAREFNADTGPELREAGLANFGGRPREALALLREVVRREPDNFDAWLVMASVATEIDPGLAARARARVRELNPLQFRRRE